MGIFDIFTGDSAKEAAAANQARLGALKTEGLGYLDAGKTGALGALDTAGGKFGDLATKYGTGTNLYLDSLGVNGADGTARARDAYTATPGYDWRVSQALDQTKRAAAATGGLGGGNTLAALSDRAGNMAAADYSGWQDRLAGLISPEVAGTTGGAGIDTAKAGVYTNDANSRVNLASGVTNGINNQETQAANAEMAGSGNLWNFGLNLAKLGTGFLGGKAA